MGEVYLAEQQSIGSKVAIKLLHRISRRTKCTSRASSTRRARSAGSSTPASARSSTSGFHDATGQAYLIMEYLEGESLTRRIARTGRLERKELADLGRQIASVLDATHRRHHAPRSQARQHLHRPDRELASGERVKVLDFGIAKLTGTLGRPYRHARPARWARRRTWRPSSGATRRRSTAAPTSTRSAASLFEMACGRPPFIVTNVAEACAKHLHDEPPRIRSLVPELPADRSTA